MIIIRCALVGVAAIVLLMYIVFTPQRKESGKNSEEPRPVSNSQIDNVSSKIFAKWTKNDTKIFAEYGRIKPSIILCGIAKCGTTTLTYQLHKFPSISYGLKERPLLEQHFYDFEPDKEKYVKYILRYDHYKEGSIKRTLDATPSYGNVLSLDSPSKAGFIDIELFRKYYTPEQLKRLTFIISVCNPVKRYLSHMNWFHGGDPNVHLESFIQDPETTVRDHPVRDAFRRGYYGQIIKKFAESYPESQIVVIESEYFYGNQKSTIEELVRILGLEESVRIHPYKSPLSLKKKHFNLTSLSTQLLHDMFQPHVTELKHVISQFENVESIPSVEFFQM